jgi:hypothetical protein
LTLKKVEEALTALSQEDDNEVLDKARLVFIHSRKEDLDIDEPSCQVLLRSSLFYGEPWEPWMEGLESTDSTLGTLSSFYNASPDEDVRRRIIEAMRVISGGLVDQMLLEIALVDNSPTVREVAALASAERGYRLRITDESSEREPGGRVDGTPTFDRAGEISRAVYGSRRVRRSLVGLC